MQFGSGTGKEYVLLIGQCCLAVVFGIVALSKIPWERLPPTYVVALALSPTAFGKTTAASSQQALNSSFPDMAFMGVPVLTAVIGNLVSSFVLLPLTLTLSEAGKSTTKGKDGEPGGMAIVWTSLLGACKQPLVWAPMLGIVIAVLKLSMPEVATKSLKLIGSATSGVVLFALGPAPSGQKLHVGWAALVNTALKMLAQPAVMLLLAVLLGATAPTGVR